MAEPLLSEPWVDYASTQYVIYKALDAWLSLFPSDAARTRMLADIREQLGSLTPSKPEAEPTSPQATAIISLLSAAKFAGFVTARATVNLGGTLVLELQPGPQTEK